MLHFNNPRHFRDQLLVIQERLNDEEMNCIKPHPLRIKL